MLGQGSSAQAQGIMYALPLYHQKQSIPPLVGTRYTPSESITIPDKTSVAENALSHESNPST